MDNHCWTCKLYMSNFIQIITKVIDKIDDIVYTCRPQQPIAFMMEALCITLVPMPHSLALSNRSACVVALWQQTHVTRILCAHIYYIYYEKSYISTHEIHMKYYHMWIHTHIHAHTHTMIHTLSGLWPFQGELGLAGWKTGAYLSRCQL